MPIVLFHLKFMLGVRNEIFKKLIQLLLKYLPITKKRGQKWEKKKKFSLILLKERVVRNDRLCGSRREWQVGASGVRAGGDGQAQPSSLLRGAWGATIHSPHPPPNQSHTATLDFLLLSPPFKFCLLFLFCSIKGLIFN